MIENEITVEQETTIIGGGTTYEAGENITIENNVISAVDTTYTAGENVNISEENVISSTDTIYDDTEVKADITNLQNNKADKNEIPDVSNFITKNVNDLTYYTLATNTGHSIELSINSSTYVMTLNLKNSAGTVISTDTLDLPLESVVVNGSYDSTNKKIILTLQSGSTIDIPVGDLIRGLQSEITSNNKLNADLVDDTNSTNKFFSGNYNDLSNKPTIPTVPTNVSAFTNDAGYLTQHQDISGKQDIMQYSTMPTASDDNLGKIAQYIGTTDSTYTNGYFYQCVSDGQSTPIYSWTNINVQNSGGGNTSQANTYTINMNALTITSDADIAPYVDVLTEIKNKIDNGDTNFGIMVRRSSIETNVFYESKSTYLNEVTYKFKTYTADSIGAPHRAFINANNGAMIISYGAGFSFVYNTTTNKFTKVTGEFKASEQIVVKVLATDINNNYQNNYVPTLDGHPANKKYVDNKPTTYTGYDATKTQVLKNINGTLTWVTEE